MYVMFQLIDRTKGYWPRSYEQAAKVFSLVLTCLLISLKMIAIALFQHKLTVNTNVLVNKHLFVIIVNW